MLKVYMTSLLRRGWTIWAKFGNLNQNSTQITVIWSKSQSEEFQYGGRLFFFQTGSSHIGAADCDRPMSTMYGLQIDFDLRKK